LRHKSKPKLKEKELNMVYCIRKKFGSIVTKQAFFNFL